MHDRCRIFRIWELVHDLLGSRFKTLVIKFFRFVDQRVDYEYLASFRDLVTHELVHLGPLSLGHMHRAHRLSSRRKLVYHRHIQVAVQCHRQGARNRRSRHDEHVRERSACGLAPQLRPLLHTEPVLLIDDCQSEILEDYSVLYESMRSDYDAYASVRKTGMDLSSFRSLRAACQKG